jgi:CRP-like cAMP-binding protein
MSSPPRNQLLAALSQRDSERLHPHLRLVELSERAVLVEAGKPVERVYFPHSGVISLVANFSNGQSVDVAMIGRDSVFGASAALGGRMSRTTAIVRLPGTASVLDAAHLHVADDGTAPLREALLQHEEALFAQVQQAAACNAVHGLQARLSRHLVRLRDLAGDDTLYATQELLAEMLGVQRNSVSIIANALQQAELIRYRRGAIQIVNLEGLRAIACECCRVVEMQYQRLAHREPSIPVHFAARAGAANDSPRFAEDSS